VENYGGYGISLGNLAVVYHLQGRHEQAMPYFDEAIAILCNAFGREHGRVKKLTSFHEECLAKLRIEKDGSLLQEAGV